MLSSKLHTCNVDMHTWHSCTLIACILYSMMGIHGRMYGNTRTSICKHAWTCTCMIEEVLGSAVGWLVGATHKLLCV